jgi:hypothetical protein
MTRFSTGIPKVWTYTCRVCGQPGTTTDAPSRRTHPGECEQRRKLHRTAKRKKKAKP